MAATRTTSFYAPPEHIADGRLTLPPEESQHLARVLRHQAGDEITVVDGSGSTYRVLLETVDARAAAGRIISTARNAAELEHRVTIACGILKQPARFETLVEKLVELGVYRIIPLVTARTEKPRLKLDRLEKITIAAMKQSGRSRLPQIGETVLLDHLLAEEQAGLKAIGHEQSTDAPLLSQLLTAEEWSSVTILIGPEGGFSEEEVARAQAAGFRVAHLGVRRLRGETAGILAAGAAMLSAEEKQRVRRK